jgi:hypothetical protein
MSWPLVAKAVGVLIALYLLLLVLTVPGNPIQGSGSGNQIEQQEK